jgi:hypothetical protein
MRERQLPPKWRPAACGCRRVSHANLHGAPYRSAVLASKLAVATEPPGHGKRAEEVLALLARAVRQFHIYPPTSAMCLDAVKACLEALRHLEDRDQLQVRVNPAALILDDRPIGSGTVVEQELSRRLHRAGAATLFIDRAATPRDLTRFCCDLITTAPPSGQHTPARLDELLTEHGVEKIGVLMAHRPEVLPIGAPPTPLLEMVARERIRREALPGGTGPVTHLYPPDKGWVRMDPSASLSTVSLADLAMLVDDPGALATMLMRLTDEELPERDAREVALARKFSDLATVFASLEPRLARIMFGRLAQAVLALDDTRRRELLRRTILPGLLDGRVDGRILHDFPDLELADSLCLLLELETAAPELLATALSRLELSDDRRAAVAPLLERRLQQRAPDASSGSPQRAAEDYARKLIRVDPSPTRTFAEFAAFNLAIDDETVESVNGVVEDIRTTDVIREQVRCLRHLVWIEPSPQLAERFLARAAILMGSVERAERWQEVAAWAREHGELAAALREQRPDVADAIHRALEGFCTPGRVGRVLELTRDEDRRQEAADVVGAFGTAVVPAILHLLATAPSSQGTGIVQLLCADAVRFAPALTPALERSPAPVVRTIARILGHAGAPYARRVGDLLSHPDEQVVREALRALTRIATPPAAAIVAGRVRDGSGWLAAAAEEALWRFPAFEAERQARELLERRDFVLRQPAVAGRLLDRVSQPGATGLESLLAGLAALRFRLWNPALVRVARKAHALARRGA